MVGPGRPPRTNQTPELNAMELIANAMREQAQATASLVAHLTRGTPSGSTDFIGANEQVSGFVEFRKSFPLSFTKEYDRVAVETL